MAWKREDTRGMAAGEELGKENHVGWGETGKDTGGAAERERNRKEDSDSVFIQPYS